MSYRGTDKEEEIGDAEVMYELVLTNYEVKRMFYGIVRDWFKGAKRDYNDFIKALLNGNLKFSYILDSEVLIKYNEY